MHTSEITINNQSMVENTQSRSAPTATSAIENYTHKTLVNQTHIVVSKYSRSLSIDSSIPAMPSMNTRIMVPFAPVHEMVTSSSNSYFPSMQQITEENSISRSNSGTSSDLFFPGDLGHKGKEDKLPLHGGLKNPIWVPPYSCTHQGTNGEMCYMCRKDTDCSLEKREQRPDFTVLNVYGPRAPTKKCKCGIITTLTTCFSVFVTVFIVIFVLYDCVFAVHDRM
ncbi:unnamed protein product [Meganyctiphanes norvegica]|uniref:Uncharacterized protein n=1 Tax=Meganyctiphanes norvegica TaxID=48144 RepID=A0AAV2SS67_MEGNR